MLGIDMLRGDMTAAIWRKKSRAGTGEAAGQGILAVRRRERGAGGFDRRIRQSEGDMAAEALLKKYRPMTETTYYTLLAVMRPRHGYAIMQFVNGLTEGRIRLGTGTLYTMTGRLQEDGLISMVAQDNGKKTYQITETGRELLILETERLKYQLQNGTQILRGGIEDGSEA